MKPENLERVHRQIEGLLGSTRRRARESQSMIERLMGRRDISDALKEGITGSNEDHYLSGLRDGLAVARDLATPRAKRLIEEAELHESATLRRMHALNSSQGSRVPSEDPIL